MTPEVPKKFLASIVRGPRLLKQRRVRSPKCPRSTKMSTHNQKSESQSQEPVVSQENVVETGCCGGAPAEGSDACCVLDAKIKSRGGSGCGCAPRGAGGVQKGCC